MKITLIFGCVILWMVFVYWFAAPVIEDSGITHYALTKSYVRDGDFSLVTDPLYGLKSQVHWYYGGDSHRKPASFSPGFAYSYSFFLKSFPNLGLVKHITGNQSHNRSQIPRVDSFSLLLGTLCWTFLLILLTLRFLVERWSSALSNWTVFLVFLGTPLFFYALASPASSVTLEALCLCLSLKFLYRSRSDEVFNKELYIFLAGLASGWLLLINNLMFPVVLVFALAGLSGDQIHRSRSTLVFSRLGVFIVGVAPFLTFQCLYNVKYYGSWFAFGFWPDLKLGLNLHLLSDLFFPARGFFFCFPLVVFSVIGLCWLMKRDRWLSLISLSILAAWLTGFWFFPDHYSSTYWGATGLTALFPVFTLGIAELLSKQKMFWSVTLTILTLISFLTTGLYSSLNHLSPQSRAGFPVYKTWVKATTEMKNLNLFSPFSLINYAAKEGPVPAPLPNLISHLGKPETVLLGGLKGHFDPHDPDILHGDFGVRSKAENSVTFTFELWPFFDKDKNYLSQTLMAAYDIPVILPQGKHHIHWHFNQTGKLSFDIPNYHGEASASRIQWRGTQSGYLTRAHVRISVKSNDITRFYITDIERLL